MGLPLVERQPCASFGSGHAIQNKVRSFFLTGRDILVSEKVLFSIVISISIDVFCVMLRDDRHIAVAGNRFIGEYLFKSVHGFYCIFCCYYFA